MKYIVECGKEDDEFVTVIPDLNYTSTYGKDEKESLENIKEAALLYLEGLEELPSTEFISNKKEENIRVIEIIKDNDEFKITKISKLSN